jgi:hypothetical protein
VGVGAVVGVLEGEGFGVAGSAPLPPTLLDTTQQLPPSGLLQPHLSSKKLHYIPLTYILCSEKLIKGEKGLRLSL